jgi:hypothetical protein
MPFERVRLSCAPAPPAACPQGPDATLQVHIALHAAYVYLTRPTAAKPQTELDQAPLFTPDHPAAVELERPQSTQDTPARTTSGLGFPGKVEARAVVPGVRPRLPRQGRSSCRRPRTLSGARVSAFGSTSSSAPLLCPLPIRRPSTVSRQEKGSLGRLPLPGHALIQRQRRGARRAEVSSELLRGASPTWPGEARAPGRTEPSDQAIVQPNVQRPWYGGSQCSTRLKSSLECTYIQGNFLSASNIGNPHTRAAEHWAEQCPLNGFGLAVSRRPPRPAPRAQMQLSRCTSPCTPRTST